MYGAPKFTKHSFIPPMTISEEEFNEIRLSTNYAKAVVKPDWIFLWVNYGKQFLFWSVPVIVAWLNANFLMTVLPEYVWIILFILATIAFNMALRYGLSAYSLWEFIQKKQKFYSTVKGIVDKTGTYPLFVERFRNRNVR